jgi:hypothetical protein
MEQPGLAGRHRDKNGQIARKHGNALVSTLRQTSDLVSRPASMATSS